MRILIVDDHVDTSDILGMLLESMGHDTAVAYTGSAALAAVEVFKPELVLLDIRLPDMSGYDVARAIRDMARGDEIFIVAATGSNKVDDSAFDLHQLKPFGMDKLKDVLTLVS